MEPTLAELRLTAVPGSSRCLRGRCQGDAGRGRRGLVITFTGARAAVRTEALAVISDRFGAFLDTHPGADRAFHRAMARRGRESDDSLLDRASSSGAQRLARRLLDLVARCGEPTAGGTALAVPLSQAELASWIGVTRATVTRALQQWRRRRLVTTGHGWITVADAAGLRRVAGLPPPGPGA